MSFYVYQLGNKGPIKVINLEELMTENQVKLRIIESEDTDYNPNDINYTLVIGVTQPDEAIRKALKGGFGKS